MSLQISLSEALKYYVDRAREWGMSPIPDAERLTIILARMREDAANKRLAYQQALAAEVALQDPENADRGQLPVLRAKLAKYQRHGEQWGAEYAGVTNKVKKARLMDRMQQASANVGSLQAEITGLEEVLATRRETTQLRKMAFEAARENYEMLRQQGPALVALARSHREAQKERERAAQETHGQADTDIEAILVQLRQDVDDARSEDRAAELIGDEDYELSLDEVIAAEEEQAQSDKMIAGWIGK